MEKFEFYNPVRVVFGPGELKRIGPEAKALGQTALLVSYKEPGPLKEVLARIEAILAAEGVKAVPFYGVSANPTIQQVEEGVKKAKAEGAQVVIGVGGGSAMDAAKAIAAGVLYRQPLWNMIVSRHDQAVAVSPTEALPIILVPTLPATSSEMNAGAVISNEKTLEKSYVFANPLYAKVSILDPELTLTLPAYQTGCGAADAVSHVMELYLNGVDDTPLQDRLMEGIILTIMECMEKLKKDARDLAARTNLMWAATVAWNGWTQPGVASGVPMHLIAHVLSARYNTTHGASLAVVMPAFMRRFWKVRPQRYLQFAERIFGMQTKGQKPEKLVPQVIQKFEDWLKGLGVQTRLPEVGIKAEAVEALTEEVARVSFGPDGKLGARTPATKEDVREILKLAL
jgi:alcohol dehydrogenase YqhD (iron-dependent ADH family)